MGREGEFHATKECPEYKGQAGDFCTIKSSNIDEIESGSKVVYASAAGPTALDSDNAALERFSDNACAAAASPRPRMI
jgi:hypothetical protein